MLVEIVQFVALVLTALSMSVHFGTWLTERPIRRTQSGALFTEVQQGRDQVAAQVMPILENAAIIFIGIGVFLVREVSAAFILSLVGFLLVLSDMIITLTKNVPINRKVQSWKVDSPPNEWKSLRDRWEKFHSIRTFLIVLGFIFYTASVVFFRFP